MSGRAGATFSGDLLGSRRLAVSLFMFLAVAGTECSIARHLFPAIVHEARSDHEGGAVAGKLRLWRVHSLTGLIRELF